MARTGKIPTTETTTTHGIDGTTVVTVTMPVPQNVTGGEPGGPGAPGYVYRDDAGFLEKARATPDNREQIIADHLHMFRSVTDGVNWQMVGEEETRLRTLFGGS